MSKNKSQKILNIIIILLVIALIVMVGMVIYDATITKNKDENVDVIQTETSQKQNNEVIEDEKIEENKEENKEEYIGEEEKSTQEEEDTELTNDEKALQLAKKEWGEDDNTVTYSIEEKKGNIYYIAVKSNATTISWYEVNTETWEINEFY